MSGRAAVSLPLRLALRTHLSPRTPTRCIHTLSRTPPTVTRRNHPTPGTLRLLRQNQQRRHFAKDSTGSISENAKIIFRAHPIQMSFAISMIFAGIGFLVYLNYFYQSYIIGAYHNFPEEVAVKLRRAIYFSKTDLDPNQAVKYFKQALQIAEEIGMDPMSDEIMGVKIEVASLMERIHNFPKAIEVLERIRADNMRWLDMFGDREDLKQKRTRVLGKTVGVNVKLAEHYSNPAVWDRDMAEQRLVWAIETVYKEKQRRENAKVTDEDEGSWLSYDEIGAVTESLAQNYEENDKHYLATPLYLHCLQLKETVDCHTVTLMSNVASCVAQQSPRAARAAQAYAESTNIRPSSLATGPVASKETMVENARLWAQKAVDTAATIKPPLRTEECDVGCAVATHNLGELAERLGDKETARRRYKEAVSLARGIGFQEGVENSSERLRELEGKK